MNHHVGSLKWLAQQLVARLAQEGYRTDLDEVFDAAEDERLTDYLEHHFQVDLGTLDDGRPRVVLDKAFSRLANATTPADFGMVEEAGQTLNNGLALVLMWLLEIMTAPKRRAKERAVARRSGCVEGVGRGYASRTWKHPRRPLACGG